MTLCHSMCSAYFVQCHLYLFVRFNNKAILLRQWPASCSTNSSFRLSWQQHSCKRNAHEKKNGWLYFHKSVDGNQNFTATASYFGEKINIIFLINLGLFNQVDNWSSHSQISMKLFLVYIYIHCRKKNTNKSHIHAIKVLKSRTLYRFSDISYRFPLVVVDVMITFIS